MRRELWDKNHDNLRKQLKRIRVEAGLTQIGLAEALDTTQSFISKVERGERNLDFIEVLQVCKACNYPPEKLIKTLKI